MKKGNGLPVFANVAIGPCVVYKKTPQAGSGICGTPAEEQEKFEEACLRARQQLSSLFEDACRDLGAEHAAIIDVQILMLNDPDFLEGVAERIREGTSAADAAETTGNMLAQLFAMMEDDYMNARAADIRDVSSRVAGILRGSATFSLPEGNFILIAEDLAPSKTVQLPRERILGFVTQKGSANSHTAILARMLGIPSLVQADIDLDDAESSNICAIDGFTGQWFLDPDEKTLAMLQKKQQAASADLAMLEDYRGRVSITRSGKQIHLYANISSSQDADAAINADAEGIGLLRSEFLYLGRDNLPTEDELFEAYQQIAVIAKEKPVIIRTLDIGADKQADYLGLPQEENPALGLRGLRLCLENEELFKTQLRAIYRASTFGNVHMMFPMVTSLWELQEAKRFCDKVRTELAVGKIPIGVMIETPAAAIMAAELASEADFFSVGTNDLTQYTLAVDRQNAHLGRFYDSHHPAVLALLEHIAACARNAGIWAGICGELAADAALTEEFIKMGYAELSMSPGAILATRRRICESEV